MAATTHAWTAPGGRERLRVVAAFAASLAVHALLLGAARGWRPVDVATPHIFVVTMLERGGGDGAERAGAGGAAPETTVRGGIEIPSPASPAVAAAPPPIARREAPVGPPRPSKATVVASAPHERARSEEAPALRSDALAASASGVGVRSDGASASAAATASTGEGAAAAGTTDAGGRGEGRGSGRGDGVGAGEGDGLRAFCASCPAPEYPARARRMGWQGTVDVALAIGGDGAVVDASVRRSSGYPPLDDVALDVARRSRFTVPVAGESLRGELRYRFVLDAAVARR